MSIGFLMKIKQFVFVSKVGMNKINNVINAWLVVLIANKKTNVENAMKPIVLLKLLKVNASAKLNFISKIKNAWIVGKLFSVALNVLMGIHAQNVKIHLL